MGIESDQLVYDYLSRVGDLAQQRQLSSGTRMQLVSALRGEIDRERAKAIADNPASVRRILGRIGTPDEVVTAAGSGGSDTPPPFPTGAGPAPPTSGSAPPSATPSPGLPQQRVRRRVPRPRKFWAAESNGAVEASSDPPAPAGALPPHVAGLDELGGSGMGPDVDWWRVESTPFGVGERVAGFTGGVEIPEILKPPPPPEDETEDETAEDGVEAEAETAAEGRGAFRWIRFLPRLGRRRAGVVTEGGSGLGSPLLLVAAALLIAGALLSSLLALGGGWLIAWASRGLTVIQKKIAVLGMPGVAVAGGLVWLWGRSNERWGTAIPTDGMRDALVETWPWVLKGAAVGSALYLVWRARKPVE
ncbi:hypothetical protein [Streptomyces albipurpureus]|uniref:Integral membrane protein n=1 Tax=Streptomyces albipurpureus TaxID=2897419 RepID=A0ABT0UTA9_9ACTN|nr:hypothetical protein [Streptomyces sp. CWNU-1]MCM2391837.1 hypothetical protein [Streptomyces sp. CWNU-1]